MSTSKELRDEAEQLRKNAAKLEEQAKNLAYEESQLAKAQYTQDLVENKNAHLRIVMTYQEPPPSNTYPADIDGRGSMFIKTVNYDHFLEIFGYRIMLDQKDVYGLKGHMQSLGLINLLNSLIVKYPSTTHKYVTDDAPYEKYQ